jgi:hypothetical protein
MDKEKYISKIVGRLDDDIVMVLCDCGGTDHHLFITRWEDEDTGKVRDYLFGIVPVQPSVWQRIKWGIKYMVYGPQVAEIVVNDQAMNKLIEVLQEFQRRK